ncbi:MAG: amidohydrolase family protein [Ginsengibacter sp.]
MKQYDIIIRNGLIYDGNGGKPYKSDLAINADTIAFIGNLKEAKAKKTIDAHGMVVSPGFINMLSWSNVSLIHDGHSQGEIRQGVTLEVMGEGNSMGPLNPAMRMKMGEGQGDIKYDVKWNTLGEYLNYMEKKGISCNIASFIGATTCREYVIGEDNRPATEQELIQMRSLVSQAMKEGAMGVGSSLIYPPAFFASTKELTELCKEASKYNGSYISHMRNEGNNLLQAIDELITIARDAKIHAEIYHLKEAGKQNWNKLDEVISKINKARASGINITADMYTYTAGATGLTASFPPSLQDGGFGKLQKRLQDPLIRTEMKKQMNTNTNEWDNLYFSAGSPDSILLLSFRNDTLKKYTGMSLAQVAKTRGTPPEETAMDLIYQDSSRVGTAYFLMSEANVRKQIKQPWMSFGSDAASMAPEGLFLKSSTHPRAYGNFTRVIGKYCRDEKVITLQNAIYKLSKLPATNLHLKKRGLLKVGNYADVLIFDPEKVNDHATYENPHQYSTGMIDVFVNGVQVLDNGNHTGATPGRFVKGPGYVK